ncbi:hypothetical protein SAMN04487833_10615 [Sarcina sp. DSM 11001]|uniref:hypothetical protein n=1 Tax=Sarcina sp. DSM 11001 TaxID=1798184 RepID=UPI00088D14D6|nr:hypothetical protein [Sarcina sp. DSM 11001]SDK69661.1 hypothetical protein SAMN04487833_10615 [Sarcina sp. DSM 11001]
MEKFTIEIAGIPVLIRCRYSVNRDFLRDYLSEKEPVCTIEPSAEDLVRMQSDFDRMNEAEGFPARRRSDEFLENNAIHSLLAEKLVGHGVLLMHGSALCMDGEAYIFTAKSGTGKSTHTRLWREMFGDRVWMINDDKPMLRIFGEKETGKGACADSCRDAAGNDRNDHVNERVMVYGTPWNGKHRLSRNACAPLKAIVNLYRDEQNHIEPMTKADAFPELMKRAFFSQNPSTMAGIMILEKKILNAVDFYTLGCNMEPEAARTAWEGMNGLLAKGSL